MILLDEHHKWKVMIWLEGYSSYFPSNFGISNEILVGMGGQTDSCKMGSLVIFVKSRRLILSIYGILVVICRSGGGGGGNEGGGGTPIIKPD
jgi:hypothetical protein